MIKKILISTSRTVSRMSICLCCILKDWIQYEELSSEDALPSDVFDADAFNSSLYATQFSLSEHLANVPNVVICPQASGDENGDVSTHVQ